MKKRKQIITLFLVFFLGISIIPGFSAQAETDASQPGDTITESTGQNEETTTEEESTTGKEEETTTEDPGTTVETENDVLLKQQNITFLTLINKERLKRGLSPLVFTSSMMQAAQTRAKELEISCSDIRPDSSEAWYTVFGEKDIVHDMTAMTSSTNRLYNASEFRASGSTSAATMYNAWMNNSKTKTSLLKSTLTHMGLGHTTGSLTINGKKDTNPWVLLLIGKYKPDSIEVKENTTAQTYPTGLSIDDMGFTLSVRSISPEGYPCTGEMPILSEMCSGYSTTKSGTQKVTVKYKCGTSTLTTSFPVKTKKVTPKTPTRFSAAPSTYNSVTIKWAPVENATSYKIYRSAKKSTGYTVIKTLKAGDLTLNSSGVYTYKNTGLLSGKQYYYKVRAFAGGVGSNATKADGAKPMVDGPTSVKATRKSATSIKVTWKKASHATSYKVLYKTSKKSAYKRAGVTKKNYFVIKGLSKKKKYFYIKVQSYRNGRPGKFSKMITKKMR